MERGVPIDSVGHSQAARWLALQRGNYSRPATDRPARRDADRHQGSRHSSCRHQHGSEKCKNDPRRSSLLTFVVHRRKAGQTASCSRQRSHAIRQQSSSTWQPICAAKSGAGPGCDDPRDAKELLCQFLGFHGHTAIMTAWLLHQPMPVRFLSVSHSSLVCTRAFQCDASSYL